MPGGAGRICTRTEPECTLYTMRDGTSVFVDNAGRWVRGEPLRNPVDKDAGHGVG